MTLGDVIKNYRTNYNMSMDMFAKKSGISKAYISLLEKNKHPENLLLHPFNVLNKPLKAWTWTFMFYSK